jgi:hypothetical protein
MRFQSSIHQSHEICNPIRLMQQFIKYDTNYTTTFIPKYATRFDENTKTIKKLCKSKMQVAGNIRTWPSSVHVPSSPCIGLKKN